jgi:hypothetical protein
VVVGRCRRTAGFRVCHPGCIGAVGPLLHR